jgi:nitroreductase
MELFFPRPDTALRRGDPCWVFYDPDSSCPTWLNGFGWPIDAEGVEALMGTHVDVRFDWKYERWPDGRKTLLETWVTITDRHSSLQVHERTFPLAADAFIVAAKRMRIET